MEGYHKSVLLREAIDALDIRDAWYLDATLGDGGHSIEIIKRGGRVLGCDVDPQALKRVQKRFKELRISEDKYKLLLGNFRDLKNLIEQMNTEGLKFAGAIFDLGVSSLQLMSPERGFSFSKEGPLDMRMDPNLAVRALDLINAGGRRELNELFKKLGDEKYSWAVANAIISAREVGKGTGIQTTKDLAELVERRLGRKRGEIHPATRVFQALRIAVNDELNALQEGLDQVIDLVEKNCRIVVISFHSLEDRIVKNSFKNWAEKGLGKADKPIKPTDEEVRDNPRCRSAKMRIFEKI